MAKRKIRTRRFFSPEIWIYPFKGPRYKGKLTGRFDI